MKKFFSCLLFIYTVMTATSAQNSTVARTEKGTTRFSQKMLGFDYNTLYLDAAVGYFSYRTDAAWTAQLSVGTRLDNASALGISVTSWGRRQIYKQAAVGIGLQYRLSFWDNLIGKIEGGYVLNRTIYDGVLHKDLVFVSGSSRPFYYKLDINYRFFRYCTLGISACQSGNLFFRRFAGSGTETVDKWRISTFTVQLGIALDTRD